MGYGGSLKDAGKAIGQSGDGGIDGIIKEDKLGLDVIYIQAKDGKMLLDPKKLEILLEVLRDKRQIKEFL